jgi:hypothetical protein
VTVPTFAALCDRSVAVAGDLVRNLKGIRRSQDLFDDLSPDPADWAAAIEAADDAVAGTPSAVVTRPFDYGTVITWSFDPAHWVATRFSDGRRFGAWYGATEIETTVYETVYHWHRFLMDSFPDEDRIIAGERRVCSVRCDATLVDLRGREPEAPGLLDRRSYAFAQQVGAFVRDRGDAGLMVGSARCNGTNVAMFEPAKLSKVRERCFLTYLCHPREDRVAVERTPGRRWLEIRPSDLY